ncbi:ABC transporter permease [Nesterenkonia alba]|uniref:ABC transporter permease n=1 Tax=Nesterenkonia alba TaxID=515814 RepID=UPI0003B330CA|nr:ABC transporter permease [Nesterenkonia alba]
MSLQQTVPGTEDLKDSTGTEVPARQRLRAGGFWRFIRKNPSGVLGMILVGTVVICAVFAPWIAPYNPTEASLGERLADPIFADETGESRYLLGGDPLGRDLLSRIIYGARISLQVGIFGVLIAAVLGTILGLIAGYVGKWFDDFIMRAADVQLAFPFILFAIIIMSVLGGGIWVIVVLLGITYWVGFARIVRGQVVALKQLEYVEAAKASGSTGLRIVLRHIFPNVFSSVLVLATLFTAEFILLEASLTFLGLGVDPTIPSWGGMLSDSRNYIDSAWWTAVFPGVAIMLTVLGFNLLGDWLRDRLDPNIKA